MHRATVKSIAKCIRKEHARFGWVDVDGVAKRLGYFVDERDFQGKVREITIGRSIGIRKGLPMRERRWLIAHGLGHSILHLEKGNQVWLYATDTSQVDQQEIEAEDFAYHLLADSLHVLHSGLGESWELSLLYGIPVRKIHYGFGGLE